MSKLTDVIKSIEVGRGSIYLRLPKMFVRNLEIKANRKFKVHLEGRKIIFELK
jgi:hypothetical protein